MKKITQAHLEGLIDDVAYHRVGETTTLCFLTLKGGFVVTGKSACLDAASFNPEMGEKVAYDNAFSQLWELEGYHIKRSQ